MRNWLRLNHQMPSFLLLLLLIILAHGCTLWRQEGYIEIQDIQVKASEERPAFVWVVATIGVGHPLCSKVLPPAQERQGNTFYITFRAIDLPTEACPLILLSREVSILLKWRLAPGIYWVIVRSSVNSLEKEFEISAKRL